MAGNIDGERIAHHDVGGAVDDGEIEVTALICRAGREVGEHVALRAQHLEGGRGARGDAGEPVDPGLGKLAE